MFSVVMPTRNRKEYILQAVESVLSQPVDLELIIQNSGESIKDILPNDPRIKLYEEPEHVGFAVQTKIGLERATGDILCTLSDDDMYTPLALTHVQEQIKGYKWLYGFIMMFTGQYEYLWGEEWQGLDRLLMGNHIPQPAVFFTREAYTEAGPWSTEADLASDYEYWLRLAFKSEPKFIKNIIARYRIHPNQITSKNTDQQVLQAKEISSKYQNEYRSIQQSSDTKEDSI